MIFYVQKLVCLKFRLSSNTLAIESTHECFLEEIWEGGTAIRLLERDVHAHLDRYYNRRCKYTNFDLQKD